MQKILFNDKYGLTQAVLEGRKTMTRREIKCPQTQHGIDVSGFAVHTFFNQCREVVNLDYDDREIGALEPTYKVGEIVAIAQSYSSIEREIEKEGLPLNIKDEFKKSKGWANKMFVKSDLMPHTIEITGIKVERLQDCSDEDCLAEGIRKTECLTSDMKLVDRYEFENSFDRGGRVVRYGTPKDAFATLIDKVSGKGTWESNPWCFCYEFKLIK